MMASRMPFRETHNPTFCFLSLAVQSSQISKITRELLKNKQLKYGISVHGSYNLDGEDELVPYKVSKAG